MFKFILTFISVCTGISGFVFINYMSWTNPEMTYRMLFLEYPVEMIVGYMLLIGGAFLTMVFSGEHK